MSSTVQLASSSSASMPLLSLPYQPLGLSPEIGTLTPFSSGSLLRTSSSAIRSLKNMSIIDIASKLDEENSCWIHGKPGAGKKTLVSEFIDLNKYREVIWFDLSRPSSEIKKDLRKQIIQKDPIKDRIPMDEEELINELRDTRLAAGSLIIFIYAGIEHASLLELLDQSAHPFHMIVVSETQLHIKSIELKQERVSIHSEFSNRISDNVQFQRCCHFFSLFSKHPIPKHFLASIVDESTIHLLLEKKWVYETGDGLFLMQSSQFAIEVKKMRDQASPVLVELVKAFREEVPSPFEPIHPQNWAVHHIKEIFNFCYQDGNPICLEDVELCYHLSSLMADISYHHSQKEDGNIACARSSTLDGIDLLKCLILKQQRAAVQPASIVSKKAEKKSQTHSNSYSSTGSKKSQQFNQTSLFEPSPEHVKECVKILIQLDPLTGGFGFLFTQLLYQAGRIYHYDKGDVGKQASKKFLEYAFALANELKLQLTLPYPPFELVQIQRNGILYHAIDEKQIEDAINIYRNKLNSGQYQRFNLKQKTTTVIDLAKDEQHQIVCIRQIVKLEASRLLSTTHSSSVHSISPPVGLVDEEDCLTPDLVHLEELITGLGRKEVYAQRTLLNLATIYLDLGKSDKALKILESADCANSDLEMNEIQLRMKAYVIQKDFYQVVQQAKRYRLIDYYPQDSRKKYDFFIFEYPHIARNVGLNHFEFLENFEALMKRTLSNSTDIRPNEPLKAMRSPSIRYQSEKETLSIELSFFKQANDQVIASFFEEITFRLQSVLKINRENWPIEVIAGSNGSRGLVLFKLNLKSEHINAFLDAVALNWKSDYLPKERELKIRAEGPFIYFDAGLNRCLKITRNAVEELLEKGKLSSLEDTLITSKTNDELNDSEFFSKKGVYRYELERSDSLGASLPSLKGIAREGYAPSFSDDECSPEELEAQAEEMVRLRVKSEERLKNLEEMAKLKDDLENQSKKIKEAFCARFAQTSDTPQNYGIYHQYSEQYLIQKERVLLQQQGRDAQLENKIDAELSYLKAREGYLKAKKESLQAARKHQITSQIVSSEETLIEEIRQVAEQIIQNSQFQLVPVRLDKFTTEELIKQVDNISFRHPISFIYHTLKHFNENPFFEDESGLFSFQTFQNSAQEYLKKIKDLLRTTLPTIDLGLPPSASGSASSSRIASSPSVAVDDVRPIGAIPATGLILWDQQDPNLQNIRLLQEITVEECENLKDTIDFALEMKKLENEVKEKEEQLRYIKSLCPLTSEEKEIETTLSFIIKTKRDELKKRSSKPKPKSLKKKYDFIVLGVRSEESQYFPYVKTQYSTESLPSFQIASMSHAETHYERWLKQTQTSSSESQT